MKWSSITGTVHSKDKRKHDHSSPKPDDPEWARQKDLLCKTFQTTICPGCSWATLSPPKLQHLLAYTGPECRVQHYCFTCCFFFFLNRAKNKGSSHIRLDDETAVYITSQTRRRLPVLPGETDRDVRLGGDATSNLHRDKRSMTGLTDRQDEEMQLLSSDPHTAPDGVLTWCESASQMTVWMAYCIRDDKHAVR